MTMRIPSRLESGYLDYLPAIFRADGDADGPTFLGRFLLAFEQVLSGLDEVSLDDLNTGDPEDAGRVDRPGLEQILDGYVDPSQQVLAGVHRYFDPGPGQDRRTRAPEPFLPWLASWVALTLRGDWSPEEQRRFIAQIVPLYRLRGTRAGLAAMLATYAGAFAGPATGAAAGATPVQIYEFDQIPHYFQVELSLPERNPQELQRRQQVARAIIDQEKPAHTYYALRVRVPTMQIGRFSTVGVDTLLGS
jgi:phage tail-like protein